MTDHPQVHVMHGDREADGENGTLAMTFEEACRFRAPPHVLANAQRVLDRAARRMLDERLERERATLVRQASDRSAPRVCRTPGCGGHTLTRRHGFRPSLPGRRAEQGQEA